MEDIKDILNEIGYSLLDNGAQYRAKPLYRDSDNNTVLTIEKSTGKWYDFKENIGGSLEDLVKLTLGLSSVEEAQKFLEGKIDSGVKTKPKSRIKTARTFPPDSLEKLTQDNSYWNNRGVSDETLSLFQGGVASSGRMSGRYVFPIFNSREQIIGFSGRDLTGSETKPKWKHLGDKKEWRYPLKVNSKVFKINKKVILIESIGDMLSLWDSGIKNVIVTFGLDISTSLLNLLLILDPEQVTLSFNNDSGNNFAGNKAAEKGKRKLLRYFDASQIRVYLPTRKDFGEMTQGEIKEWAKK